MCKGCDGCCVFVCIVRRGAVGARVWEAWAFRHADVICLCLVCINNILAKRFNQMAPPARTIIVALDMSKSFDSYKHTDSKLLQSNIPGTIINIIANYIEGRKAYTSIQNWRSTRWRPFTNTIQHIHCRHTTTKSTSSCHGIRRWHHHHIYTHKHECSQEIHTTILTWTKQNNLTLNTDKTTCTLFIPDSAEYKSNLDLKINNTALRIATHPKLLGLTLDPKLTYSTHIHNISVEAHKPLQMIKAPTATGWGKQKVTLMATYKAVMRPALEYASSIWSHLASSTSINKLQVMQNAALRTATWCTQDTNIQHLRDETLILPIHEHLQLHASQYKQNTTYFNTPRLKNTIFNNGRYTTNIPTDPTQSLQQT